MQKGCFLQSKETALFICSVDVTVFGFAVTVHRLALTVSLIAVTVRYI